MQQPVILTQAQSILAEPLSLSVAMGIDPVDGNHICQFAGNLHLTRSQRQSMNFQPPHFINAYTRFPPNLLKMLCRPPLSFHTLGITDFFPQRRIQQR